MSALNKAFIAIITSESAWEQALTKALNGKKFLPENVIVELGTTICEKYGCYVDVAENGMYRFYKTEDVRSDNIHDGAKKMWQRRVAPYHNIKRSKRGGSRSKQVDVVQQLVEKFEALSKAQQAKFLRIVK